MAISNYHRLQYGMAGEDLSKGHGLFVKLGTDGRYVVTAAATDSVIGPVITPAAENFELGICMERGVLVPARAAGAIPVGAGVSLTTGGKIMRYGGTGPYIGICQEAATAADDIVTIIFLGLTYRA